MVRRLKFHDYYDIQLEPQLHNVVNHNSNIIQEWYIFVHQENVIIESFANEHVRKPFLDAHNHLQSKYFSLAASTHPKHFLMCLMCGVIDNNEEP